MSEEPYVITVTAFDLSADDAEAMFDRVAEAAHALDEQVTCAGTPRPPSSPSAPGEGRVRTT